MDQSRVARVVGIVYNSIFESECVDACHCTADKDDLSSWESDCGSDDEEDRACGTLLLGPPPPVPPHPKASSPLPKCAVCLVEPATCAFQPCMHLCVCRACAFNLRDRAMVARHEFVEASCIVPSLIWIGHVKTAQERLDVQVSVSERLSRYYGLDPSCSAAVKLSILTGGPVPFRKMPRKRLFFKCVMCRQESTRLLVVRRK